jgi:hypothetical protein
MHHGIDASALRISALTLRAVHWQGASVTDKPIGDAPDEAVAASEARARRLGLSRSEYVRRGLVREAAVSHSPVGAGDLAWFGGTFGDLADSDVMSQAWQ